MKSVAIVCDGCGRDLAATGNCTAYRISVRSEGIPSRGPVVTLVHLTPPLDREYHFCGLGCLRKHSISTGETARNE